MRGSRKSLPSTQMGDKVRVGTSESDDKRALRPSIHISSYRNVRKILVISQISKENDSVKTAYLFVWTRNGVIESDSLIICCSVSSFTTMLRSRKVQRRGNNSLLEHFSGMNE